MDLVARILYNLVRLYVGAIWTLAGAGKLTDRPEGSFLAGGQRKRPTMARLGIRAFSTVEIAIGSLLLSRRQFPIIPALSAALFTAFGALRLLRKVPARCGCFGSLQGDRELQLPQLLLWAGLSGWLAFSSRAPSTRRPLE